MKKLLAIAVAAALVAPAAAMADTTLYGKLHASVGSVKNAGGSAETVVESHASRIGIKGSTALDNGMEATYGVEYGLNLDGENNSNTDAANTLTARNTFVGLKGGFGEVRVGRHDTPAKLATAGQDIFADTYADIANVILADNLRVDNAVAYINKFGPVGVAVAHTTSIGKVPVGTWNGATVDFGVQDADGAPGVEANDFMVNYSKGPMYAALGHTNVQGVLKNTNVGIGYKAEAGHQANLILENTKPNGGGDTIKSTVLNGVYKIGNVGLKAQLGTNKSGGDKATANAVGVDYNLGKKTSVYGLLANQKDDAGDKSTATAVGLVTEF